MPKLRDLRIQIQEQLNVKNNKNKSIKERVNANLESRKLKSKLNEVKYGVGDEKARR